MGMKNKEIEKNKNELKKDYNNKMNEMFELSDHCNAENNKKIISKDREAKEWKQKYNESIAKVLNSIYNILSNIYIQIFNNH